jgi:hypothetical protein
MATLKKIKLKNEKELHSVIEKELEALEEGLTILKYEFAMSKGVPDFLCADSGGRLVIIEVKLQEDENILFQGLRYYNEIDRDRYVIAKMFSKKDVDPKESPRIILIAEKFSDDIRRLSTLVIPDVELYEYTVLKTEDGNEGICFHPVSLPKIEEGPTMPKSIEEIKSYMTKKELIPLFDKVVSEIKNIGENIDEYTTQDYVGFRYKGRLIGYLTPHRQSFDVGSAMIDENGRTIDYEYLRIETGTEDDSEAFQKIIKSFENIGGKPKKAK